MTEDASLLATLIKVLLTAAALMMAIVGHEIMHGYVAWRYGDDTAHSQGRLSINPIVHVDPVGTILVPALLWISGAPFLFGWAKPVPVDIMTVVRHGGYQAAIYVSLAGIAYNLSLAILAVLLFHTVGVPTDFVTLLLQLFLTQLILYNAVLAVFNLWPIPPLDGSRAVRWAAASWRQWQIVRLIDSGERYGMIILIALLVLGLGNILVGPAWWVVDALLGR